MRSDEAFHSTAWMVWAAASLAVVQSATNPFVICAAIAAMLWCAFALAPRLGPVRIMLLAGGFSLIVRVVLFGLAGQPGGTTIATIPQLRLPTLLGGFHLGGAITGEVLAHAATEGLRLAAVLVCFGVFASIVDPSRILRMTPRFLFEAGLIVTIGATFVPSLAQTARDVRDVQRIRGHRGRGLRAVAAMALPVLANTLERSARIAETLESRGYGRAGGVLDASGAQVRVQSRARAASVAGTFVTIGSAFAVAMGLWSAIIGCIFGLAVAGWGCVRLARSSPRTRYRRVRLRSVDWVLITIVAVVGAAGIVVAGGARWSAWPVLRAPDVPWLSMMLAAMLASPVAIRAVYARLLSLRSEDAEPLREDAPIAHAGAAA